MATRSPDYVTSRRGPFLLASTLERGRNSRLAITAQRCRIGWREEISKEREKIEREEISRCPLAAISGKLNSVREIERGNSTSFEFAAASPPSTRILFPFPLAIVTRSSSNFLIPAMYCRWIWKEWGNFAQRIDESLMRNQMC